MANQEKNGICVLKPVWGQRETEELIRKRHTWFGGLLSVGNPKILEMRDSYVPYFMSTVIYYRNVTSPRRCYVFENLDIGLRSGVSEIGNLEFIQAEPPRALPAIEADEERYASEIESYCMLDLLVKEYRKYIQWTIQIPEIKLIYRKKRTVKYCLSGKTRRINIYLDGISLK